MKKNPITFPTFRKNWFVKGSLTVSFIKIKIYKKNLFIKKNNNFSCKIKIPKNLQVKIIEENLFFLSTQKSSMF